MPPTANVQQRAPNGYGKIKLLLTYMKKGSDMFRRLSQYRAAELRTCEALISAKYCLEGSYAQAQQNAVLDAENKRAGRRGRNAAAAKARRQGEAAAKTVAALARKPGQLSIKDRDLARKANQLAIKDKDKAR